MLANLANFAYDPINYEYLRTLNVLQLFLDCLSDTDPLQVEFAIGGLCNAALDKQNKVHRSHIRQIYSIVANACVQERDIPLP